MLFLNLLKTAFVFGAAAVMALSSEVIMLKNATYTHTLSLPQATGNQLPSSDPNASTVEDLAFRVVCQTTSGSPLAAAVSGNVAYLAGQPASRRCCQTGELCTNIIMQSNTGSDICGPKGRCTSCNTAGEFVRRILKDCLKNGRAGGYVKQDDFTINVYVWN